MAHTEDATKTSSIFQFHPPASIVKKKSNASPRATTPRNMVLPEASFAVNAIESPAKEIPVSMEIPHSARQRGQSTHSTPNDNSHVSPTSHKYVESPAAGISTSNCSPKKQERLHRHQHSTRNHGSPLQHRSARMIYQLLTQLSIPQVLAYLLIFFGILSESATPAPKHNVPIGIGMFMIANQNKSPYTHRVIVSGLCLTSLIDYVWLLHPQVLSYNGHFRIDLENYIHVCIAICTVLKIWLIFYMYFDLGAEEETIEEDVNSPTRVTDPGIPMHYSIWQQTKYLFPRKTLPRRSHLSFEVLMRVLALIWIHGVGGVALLLLSLYATIAFQETGGVQPFRIAPLGMPLHMAMLFKSATTLSSYFVATHHMDYHGCLTLSGCDRLATYFHGADDGIVLKYTRIWSKRLKRVKILDTIMGFYLLLVFYAACRATTNINEALWIKPQAMVILVLTGTFLLILDCWVPLLIMVVAKCGTVLHSHHRKGTKDIDPYFPNQLEWEEDVEGGVEKSDEDSDSASSASEHSSSYKSSSESGYSSAEQHRRVRIHQATTPHSSRRGLSDQPHVPSLKRQHSMIVVDGNALNSDQVATIANNGKPYWIRYWDDATNRSYLVHSVTSESVWEIGALASRQPTSRPTTTRRQSTSLSETSNIHPLLPTSSSFPPQRGSARSTFSPRSDMLHLSPRPTSDTEIKFIDELSVIRPQDFLLSWDGLPDGGSFTCRVSKIPSSVDLARHLTQNDFVVVHDGLSITNQRTIHFYASSETHDLYFLGEFTFDSLSLKLFAKFRCSDVEAIVPYVKRLQLKTIVGAYAPCE